MFLFSIQSLHAAFDKTEANKKQGFSENSIFQNYGDENINILSGNLTLVHPNSSSFPVIGGFSYQLNRVYNSKIWAIDEDVCDEQQQIRTPGPVFKSPSSMGAGWIFHLGRIYQLRSCHHPDNPGDSVCAPRYYYEASDGSTHRLWAISNPGCSVIDNIPGVCYLTKDAAYIRAKHNEIIAHHIIILMTPGHYGYRMVLNIF